MPFVHANFEKKLNASMFYDGTAKALAYKKAVVSSDKETQSLKMVIDRSIHAKKIPHRSDLKLLAGTNKIPLGTRITYDLIFTFSTRFVPDPYFREIAVQWLGDKRTTGGPVLSIAIQNNHLFLEHMVNVQTGRRKLRRFPILDNIIKGNVSKWIRLHANILWSTESNGELHVQLRHHDTNKLLAKNYDLTGPNCDPTNFSPSLKFGPYKWGWAESKNAGKTEITRRVQYFRSVSVSW